MRRRVHVSCSNHGSAAQPPPTSNLDPYHTQRANKGLSLVSAVLAGGLAVLVLDSCVRTAPPGQEAQAQLDPLLSARVALLLLSLAVAHAVWRRRLGPRGTAQAGAAFLVLGSLLISAVAFYRARLGAPSTLELSWLIAWILFSPSFVRLRPLRLLLVSLLCATVVPLVFAALSVRHGVTPLLSTTHPAALLPLYACAGLALVPARLLLGPSAARAAPPPTRRVGSYRLVKRLGRGGMGEVWSAEHSLLARRAAIKLVRPRAVGKTGTPPHESGPILARFEQEAQTTAELTSPHTVRLYDYGVLPDKGIYYVMELLDGLTMERLVQRFGPVSPARAVYLLQQVCESLNEAHAAGLVHRDIKPANLMVCRIGGRDDFVKVLDFGLVRRLESAAEIKLVSSDPALLVGTPAFMAPEMIEEPASVDARADIYALGCVAYWLLTGRLVFERSTPAAVVADHVHALPIPPSLKTDQFIPLDLERLILDCLEKDPLRRPQSVDELSLRLEALQPGPRWSARRASGWWKSPPAERGVDRADDAVWGELRGKAPYQVGPSSGQRVRAGERRFARYAAERRIERLVSESSGAFPA